MKAFKNKIQKKDLTIALFLRRNNESDKFEYLFNGMEESNCHKPCKSSQVRYKEKNMNKVPNLI